jgi:quercetin dioxygenase-like cupin family protein
MKIIHYSNVEAKAFPGGHAHGAVGRVLIGQNDGAKNFCMRIFEIEPGGYTAQHAHPWEHEVFVHQGKGAFFDGNEWHTAESGTAVFIPGDTEHQIKNIGDQTMLMLCLIPSGAPAL